MSIFIFTTLFTFCLLSLVAIARPSWISHGRGEPINEQQAPGQKPVNHFAIPVPRVLVIAILTVIVSIASWVLIFSVFRIYHQPFGLGVQIVDVFIGRNAVSILFGSIVGALLSLFLLRVFYSHPGTRLSLPDKIILVFLVTFFVLGIGGEEVIRSLARRVSKVSAFGTEVAFFDRRDSSGPDRLSGSATNAASTPGNQSSKTNLPSDHSAGLEFLAALSEIISRDQRYMEMIELLLPDPPSDARLTEKRTKIEADLKTPMAISKLFIAPFAGCLSQVYSQNGDTEFVNERLAGFLPPLRLLVLPNPQPKVVAPLFAKAFVENGNAIVDYAIHLNSQSKDLTDSCNRLFYLLIAKESWYAKDSKLLAQNVAHTHGPDDDWIAQNPVQVTNYDWEIHHGKATDRDELEGIIYKYIENVVEPPNKRPYLSIVYASVMAQLDRYEAALLELDKRIKDVKYCSADGKKETPQWEDWYCMRALSTNGNLTEEWVRRPSTSVSSVLRENHIGNLYTSLSMYDTLLHLTQFRDWYAKPEISLEATEFAVRPDDHHDCVPRHQEPNEAKSPFQRLNQDQLSLLRRAFTAMLWDKLTMVDQALLHPEYVSRFSRLVGEAIAQLLQTDFSCLNAPEGEDDKDLMRAWSLRIYAQMKLRDVPATSMIRSRGSLDDDVRKGLEAVDLGLEIIRPLEQKDRGKKFPSTNAANAVPSSIPTLLDRIAPTMNIDTYQALQDVKRQLTDLRDRLDQ